MKVPAWENDRLAMPVLPLLSTIVKQRSRLRADGVVVVVVVQLIGDLKMQMLFKD